MKPPISKRPCRRGWKSSPESALPLPSGSSSSSFIPDEIIFFEILVLLPVKSLLRFQAVCKSWRATLTSTPFVRRHLELSRSTMVVVPRKYQASRFLNVFSFQPGESKCAELMVRKEFQPHGIPAFSIPLHCDGLILIPALMGTIFICNPATGEFVELPPGSPSLLHEHRVAFGFDPWSGTYKVARHFIRSYRDIPQMDVEEGGTTTTTSREYSCGHEMLTFGGDVGKEQAAWVWKATVDPPYPIKARTPICLPGAFFWSALKSMLLPAKVISNVILRFSLLDETFTVHPNPPCSDILGRNDSLCALGEKLCYIHSTSPWDISIWLAEDGPNLAWSLCRRVCLPIPRMLLAFACASTDRDKIFISVDACILLRCDLRDGSLEEIINMPRDMLYDLRNGRKINIGALFVAHYTVPYVESLLRIRPSR
ncbi:hypothetical protein CFC21_106154 [Triticum aestivum]|uniref:F-box domain-containing protein n=3 Tax=Triticum aestivum TaxID=4565 RepID=A0A3B6SM47_WHEAT|nr:hypothetical protein CFC21_106154 [Triticum aestivum]